MSINVLLICGGGSTEHEISLISADYFESILKEIPEVTTHRVCIEKDGTRTYADGRKCELRKAGLIHLDGEDIFLNYAIPCIHGYPGETGDIQSVFEMMGLPYYGPNSETSKICFNKVTTKLWFSALDIPNTPYVFANSTDDLTKVKKFFHDHGGDIFIKASNQGSSVGCFHVTNENDIEEKIKESLKLSPFALIEKTIKGRELEVSTFEYDGKVDASLPGEIECPDGFYTYEEKYAKDSHTSTKVVADVPANVQSLIQEIARKAFSGIGLKDLSRIDFFYTDSGEILVNEINTMPGHTPISMFPTMLENHGIKYVDFLKQKIINNYRKE